MGKRCSDIECPYLAQDGTCLLSEDELKDKCPARERVEHEVKDEWIDENYVKEKLRSIGVIQ